MSSSLYASYFLQALGALLTAVIFGSVYKSYRRSFLRLWARSWAALCVMLIGAALSLWLMIAHVPATDLSRVLLSLVTGCAAYVQIAYLLLGAADVTREGSATPLMQRRAVVAALLAGVVASLLFSWVVGASPARFFVRVGVRGFVTGVACIAAAIVVWRAAGLRRVGRSMVAAGLFLYGADQLNMIWLSLPSANPTFRATVALYLSFGDFTMTMTVALGVVIWLLEEAQRAAEHFAMQIEELAYRDPLTGLPNRHLFLDRLNVAIPHARREQHKLALFFLDIDRFKVINDSLGHVMGDKVLVTIGQRIANTLRVNDTVARMGGDEFTIIAPVVHGVDDAVHVAMKIREAIRHPIRIDGRELFVSASVGVSVYPDDGESSETLLKNADTAMYRAKSQGADAFQLYTPEMNAQAVEQLALENALRRALPRGEFELFYQPIVDMSTNEIMCVEAMLRWRHPELGVMRPQQFLGLAESTGMIVSIGEWAMGEACRQLAVWRRKLPRLQVAVNLSARQLRQPELVEQIGRVLAEHRLPHDALSIEVPESSAARADEQIVGTLRALRERGVRVAIDDFGTGYSSLGKLRGFPVDALKIDTRFVRDLMTDSADAGIASAVIGLAKAMRLSVIAEGVENPTQLEFLRQQQCEMWQGYLCCPPAEAGEVAPVLGRRLGSGSYRVVNPSTARDIVRS